MSGTYLNVWSDYLFALKKKLDNGEFTNRELVEWLDSNNPTILYSLITMIVNKGINDTAITDKLLSMSNKLDNENKVLGYYKIGHLAMSALLKLGIDSDVVFGGGLDSFEKEMTLKFLNDNDW